MINYYYDHLLFSTRHNNIDKWKEIEEKVSHDDVHVEIFNSKES